MAQDVIVMLDPGLGSQLRKDWQAPAGSDLRNAFDRLSVKAAWTFDPPLGNDRLDSTLTVTGENMDAVDTAARLSSVAGVAKAYIPGRRQPQDSLSADSVMFEGRSEDSGAGLVGTLQKLVDAVPGLAVQGTTVAVQFDQLSRQQSRALLGAVAAHGGKRLSPRHANPPIMFPAEDALEIRGAIQAGSLMRFYSFPGVMPQALAGKTEIEDVSGSRPQKICIYTRINYSAPGAV